MTQKPCGFCGTATAPDTMLAGLVICEDCLIAEVTAYVDLRGHYELEEALRISPFKVTK